MTPLNNRKTPMMSVFRSFEIFLSWRLMGVERLLDDFRELARFDDFLVVVFLAICLNRKIVLIIACVLFPLMEKLFFASAERTCYKASGNCESSKTNF